MWQLGRRVQSDRTLPSVRSSQPTHEDLLSISLRPWSKWNALPLFARLESECANSDLLSLSGKDESNLSCRPTTSLPIEFANVCPSNPFSPSTPSSRKLRYKLVGRDNIGTGAGLESATSSSGTVEFRTEKVSRSPFQLDPDTEHDFGADIFNVHGTDYDTESERVLLHRHDSQWTGEQSEVWRCPYPSCTSSATFTRLSDLRKHHRRHFQRYYCRISGCPRSESTFPGLPGPAQDHEQLEAASPPTTGVSSTTRKRWFASKKDRARHEAKHNPHIRCGWEGCDRVFSRLDNMKDHVRRIHGGTRRSLARLGVGHDEKV
jgi:hypothetical protein